MPKVLIDKYPLGTLKKQKTAGRYVDGYLLDNLDIMARKIASDMTFLGVGYSSTLEVGTGKSVLFTQIGEIWSELVNKHHGTNLEFTSKNIVFRPKDLIERSFQLPKYSCILLDEWEDAHYFSELGMTLRKFFRKCRQLNLFILVIIPNFFQLQTGYAISRSAFAIDVKFEGEFDRGYFSFYNFDRKRDLYIKGKKTYNYKAVMPNFHGRFTDGYGIDETKYRRAKLKDMMEQDAEDTAKVTPKQIETKAKAEMYKKIREKMPEIPVKKWAEVLEVGETTLFRWKRELEDNNIKEMATVSIPPVRQPEIINQHIQYVPEVPKSDPLRPLGGKSIHLNNPEPI